MEALPSELQLLIIENLDVLDIYHIQLTCRKLCLLIEREARSVWIRCLKRQSVKNGLFWPSFKDLSMPLELKAACTGAVPFLRTLDRASGTEGGLYSKTIKLKFPPNLLSPADVRDIYLIPGGRFVATFEGSWMAVWDMHLFKGSTVPSDALVVRHHSKDEIGWVVAVNVRNSMKVRFLICVTKAPSTQEPEPELQTGEFLRSYKVLELAYTTDVFSINTLGCISVIFTPGTGKRCAFIDLDRVVLHDGQSSIIWDFQCKQFARWPLRGISSSICDVSPFSIYLFECHGLLNPAKVFPNQGYFFYLAGEGIYGVEVPRFQPMQENWHVLPLPSRQDFIPSAFCVFHEWNHSIIAQRYGVMWPNATLEAKLSFAYELKERLSESEVGFHKYQFEFNRENPTKSTLKFLNSSTKSRDDPDLAKFNGLVVRESRLCEGQLIDLWLSEDEQDFSGALFLSPSLSHSSCDASDPPASQPNGCAGERKLVRVQLERSSELLNSGSFTDFIPDFCPSSGRMVVLWLSDDDSLVTIHSLFR